jgi:hypothetical protein
MLHLLCPICGNEVNTDILLHKQLKSVLEKDNYAVSPDFCEECQGHIDNGRTALIEIHGTFNPGDTLNCETANRTGRLFFLINDVVERMFTPEAAKHDFVFIDVELGDRLTQAQENA